LTLLNKKLSTNNYKHSLDVRTLDEWNLSITKKARHYPLTDLLKKLLIFQKMRR